MRSATAVWAGGEGSEGLLDSLVLAEVGEHSGFARSGIGAGDGGDDGGAEFRNACASES